MKNNVNYSRKLLFEDFDETFSGMNLIQIVECATWSRIVNANLKESLLDHIYVLDPTICTSISTIKPCIGDHLLIAVEIIFDKPPIVKTIKRDWRKYSKDALCDCLNDVVWNYE